MLICPLSSNQICEVVGNEKVVGGLPNSSNLTGTLRPVRFNLAIYQLYSYNSYSGLT
jgi:hypothetical protein